MFRANVTQAFVGSSKFGDETEKVWLNAVFDSKLGKEELLSLMQDSGDVHFHKNDVVGMGDLIQIFG